MMNYVYYKLKIDGIYIKILLSILLGLLTVISSVISYQNTDITIISHNDITRSFKAVTNLTWQYFLPMCCYYLYITNNIFFGIDDNYIYKFKSKSDWINSKVMQVVIMTILYTLSIFLGVFIALVVIYNIDITNLINIDLLIAWFLQTSILMVYSLICILMGILFLNKKSFAISITKIIICALPFIGFFSDNISFILDICLFNMFTIERIQQYLNGNIVFILAMLCSIIYVFINLIYYLSNKLDILKFNEY